MYNNHSRRDLFNVTCPLVIALTITLAISNLRAEDSLIWTKLPGLPDADGFAGTFAGTSHGALIVAGGANIPKDKWADVFQKVWYESAFVLERPDGPWKSGFQLPRPIGYGVAISADNSLMCFGGSDAMGHYAESFRLEWVDGRIVTTPLPSLPRPCANACGALVGRTIYIAGGIETPISTTALHTFWSLDLDSKELTWKELPAWPGPERTLAIAGASQDAFYLFSGTSLSPGSTNQPVRNYLRDAYRYKTNEGWKRIADLPRSTVAAPSPAASIGSKLVIYSGDDGANTAFQPVHDHPGFPRNGLAYDVEKDAWTVAESIPFSRATAPTVVWQNRLVIPNGEVRPRVRTPEVWALPLQPLK
jgi:N-acetylneuraminic acid mutarotase